MSIDHDVSAMCAERNGVGVGRFLYSRRMQLEGFPDIDWYDGLAFRMLEDVPVQHVFDRFADRIVSSIGREYIPVYRMADGEFEFLTGKRPVRTRRSTLPSRVGEAILNPVRNFARSVRFNTCWGETYYFWQRARALDRLRQSIRMIAQRGYLALYFARRGDGWSQEYFEPARDWFDQNEIRLDFENYLPFYAVYALLSGPRREEVLDGRRILVVTHLNEKRRISIEKALLGFGAKKVSFISISPRGAVFEDVDVTRYGQAVDLALIAAGIGSAPILKQLEPLSVPAIDVGMWMDCLIDPSRRAKRPFLRARE